MAPLAEALRERIEAAGVSGRLTASGELLTSGSALPEFYRRRGFRPAWVQGGDAAALADTLLQRVRAARTHGLRPEDYHLWTLAALLVEALRQALARTPDRAADDRSLRRADPA